MTYRLLALNIDGTLLSENARISRQTRDSIEYVKKKGVYVTLATSRPFPSAIKLAKSLKLTGHLIASDGAYIATSADDLLFMRSIPEKKALRIVEVLEQYECHIRVNHKSYSIGNKLRQKNNLIAKMTIGGGNPLFYPMTLVDSVCEQMTKELISPQKIQIQFFDSLERQKAMKQLESVIQTVRIIEKDQERIDIVSSGVSKANGLQVLGRHLGIAANEMVAIGASDSDVEMIAQVGLGVAMGNATTQVKEVADWLTRSNDQNGVSYMIREVFRKQLRVQI